jgi:protein tyrosine phosphatase (PTP) superfamily phosphohydrolase (DUF442 family)
MAVTWKTGTDLPRYFQVADGVFRGGQPTLAGMQRLKENGVKTIVSFRNNRHLTELESQEAQRLGISFVSIPLNGLTRPSASEIHEFLSIVQDQNRLPVFVHCQHGEDRTGTMIGIYRMAAQHWSAANAYHEMLQRGFHPQYVWLADAVFDYAEENGLPVAKEDRPIGIRVWDSFGDAAAGLLTLQKARSHGSETPTAVN